MTVKENSKYYVIFSTWWCSESLVSRTTVRFSNLNERRFTLKLSESEPSLSLSVTMGSSLTAVKNRVFLLLLLATSSKILESLLLLQLGARLFTCFCNQNRKRIFRKKTVKECLFCWSETYVIISNWGDTRSTCFVAHDRISRCHL